MNDRSLLEAAAKDAGHLTRSDRDSVWLVEDDGSPIRRWRPLTDDGDALRLAVKLRLNVRHSAAGVRVNTPSIDAFEELYGTDPYAATRRAIVRAAAALAAP